jgi:hypothetical protein
MIIAIGSWYPFNPSISTVVLTCIQELVRQYSKSVKHNRSEEFSPKKGKAQKLLKASE